MLRFRTSDWAEVHSGVPQGSVLGPLLFVIYVVNDIFHNKIKLFADDTKIWSPIVTVDDADGLQTDLDKMQEWTVKWLLKHIVNAKCCLLATCSTCVRPTI